MSNFERGDAVAIPATVEQGAFPGERLVTLDTLSGPISGFVRDQDMVDSDKTIHAVVVESTARGLAVQLSGSYFTTNGLAEFSADWAKRNIKAIA